MSTETTQPTLVEPGRAASGPRWWLYRRLGARYPRTIVILELQLLYGVYLGSLAAGLVWFDVPADRLATLLVVTAVYQTLLNVALAWQAVRLLGPVTRWLAGRRDKEAALTAWGAATAFPLAFLRRTAMWGFPLWSNVAWSVFAALELGLSWAQVPILVAGVFVAQLYGVSLLFLLFERAMHPVLADLAGAAPTGARIEGTGLPLRWRLLTLLPAINVVTGVTVAAVVPGSSEIGDLGVTVLAALVVSLTISLALTRLLSDSVTRPVDILRAATQRVRRGDLSARVPVLATDETGALAQSFNDMAEGLQERERLREAFGTFVDPDLAERVVEDGTDLDGEEVDVSILFLDVRDFTAFAERTSAREVVARLNELYEVVVPAVTRHSGHANKFIGDGMLAVFGAPDRLEDHAERAVEAALEIAKLVRERFGDDLRVGIGVNSGRVLVGTIGGGGRLDFTVIGDVVNTAARVEAETRETGDDVLIAEDAMRRLSTPPGDWEERGSAQLKGKSKSVRLYAPGRSDLRS